MCSGKRKVLEDENHLFQVLTGCKSHPSSVNETRCKTSLLLRKEKKHWNTYCWLKRANGDNKLNPFESWKSCGMPSYCWRYWSQSQVACQTNFSSAYLM